MSTRGRREPRHWHHENGSHRMPDPRKFVGYPRHIWDEDEKHYVEHLEAHEAEEKIPKPQLEDSEEIRMLFEIIRHAEVAIVASRQMIREKRGLSAGDPGKTVA